VNDSVVPLQLVLRGIDYSDVSISSLDKTLSAASYIRPCGRLNDKKSHMKKCEIRSDGLVQIWVEPLAFDFTSTADNVNEAHLNSGQSSLPQSTLFQCILVRFIALPTLQHATNSDLF
jgi:hypothetical protein